MGKVYRWHDSMGVAPVERRVVAPPPDPVASPVGRRVTAKELMSVDPPPDPWAIGNLPLDPASVDEVIVASYPKGFTARQVGDELRIYAPSDGPAPLTAAEIQKRNRQYWEPSKSGSAGEPRRAADAAAARAAVSMASEVSLPMPVRLRAINDANRLRHGGAR